METRNQLAKTSNKDIWKLYCNEIKSKLQAKGFGSVGNYALFMLDESQFVKYDESRVIAYLIEYAEVLFGLRVENLSVNLWQAAFSSICERFPNIMVHDIQNAFRYAEIEKKQYTTLTRDELIEPIKDYWNKKMTVLSEIDALKVRDQKEIDSLNKEIEFREKAKQMYLEALSSDQEWKGDEFLANTIAKNMRFSLTEKVKNEICKKAKQEYVDRTSKIKNNDFTMVPSWEKIYARLFIEECLRRKLKFVNE